MIVNKYFHTEGTENLDDRFELLSDRINYMNAQYLKMFKEEFSNIKLEGDVAFLYAGGVTSHTSESRNYVGDFESTQPMLEGGPTIKTLSSYMMHKYIGLLHKAGNNITYANINGNTCASSLYSIYEAEQLLSSDRVDHVVIVAEEKTNASTIRIFHEHNIDVKVGEGFACVVLSNNGKGQTISHTKWEYSYNRNPFLVDSKGYEKVYSESKLVKGHKTGTSQNDTAEEEVFGDTFGYKDSIGHCQGASGLIELCLVLDNRLEDVLCVASGLGGFYSSCIVNEV